MAKKKESTTVRQFLYLDTEQIRSFVAQIEKGLPEKKEPVSFKRSVGGGKGSIKLPTIAEVGIDGSVLWESSSTETISMHHYLFSIFEEAIRLSNKSLTVDSHTKLATCLGQLETGSSFVFIKGMIQINPVERPFIEPISELVNWLMKQQKKLLKEGVPIQETGIVPYMDKIPRNLADKLKSLIPVESFSMTVTVEKLPLQFNGTLYSKNFHSEDAVNILLTPPDQAGSEIIVFGITNTMPIIGEVGISSINLTPLAVYREY